MKHLAQQIENFIYEFDTYHYQDECLDRMQTVERIQTQLMDLTVFQQVDKIWNDKNLSDEELFDNLGKILKL